MRGWGVRERERVEKYSRRTLEQQKYERRRTHSCSEREGIFGQGDEDMEEERREIREDNELRNRQGLCLTKHLFNLFDIFFVMPAIYLLQAAMVIYTVPLLAYLLFD